jgi:hypothetical protein
MRAIPAMLKNIEITRNAQSGKPSKKTVWVRCGIAVTAVPALVAGYNG